VGREEELACLNQAFAHIQRKLQGIDDQNPSPAIIGIKSDAGLGKTRLVHEFCQQHQNHLIMIACAASGILRSPFNIFINLLENEFKLSLSEAQKVKKEKLEAGFKRLAETLGDQDKEALMDKLPLIGLLLEIPYPDPRIRQSGNELLTHLRLALQELIQRIIAVHASRGLPIVLILDDLHWLDESSAAVFGFLMERLFWREDAALKSQILLLLQYRHDYLLPTAIAQYPAFKELELKALDDLEITRLLRHYTADFKLSDEVLNKVKELSSGNPFYLEEWCNYLYELPSRDPENLPIPANLHALILSRLDLLEKTIRLLLQKAAVIGQEFFVDILSWIEDKLYDPIDVKETLAQLENQAFILKLLGFDYSAYFFKHITTRDVAYQTLLLENRKILHLLSAEAIEELYPERQAEFLYPLAEHYHHAEIPQKAMYYLGKAAAACQKVFSNSDAIRYYQKLLGWLRQFPASPDDAAQGLEPPPSLAGILINIADIYSLTGNWDEAESHLQEAYLQASQLANPEELFDCHRLKGILAFRKGKMDMVLAEWESGLNCANELDDRHPSDTSKRLLSIVHGNLGIWYQHHKQSELALKHHQLCLDYARQTDNQIQIAKTLSNLGLYSIHLGKYAEAEKLLNQCLVICKEEQLLQLESIALGNLGFLHHKQGELDRAMPFYEQKWLLVDKLDDMAERIKVLGNIGNLHRDKGQHREALEYYRKVLRLKDRLGNRFELATTHSVIALELLEIGDVSEALSQIDKALELATGKDKQSYEYFHYKAEILLAFGDAEQAENLNRQALHKAKEIGFGGLVKACEELQQKLMEDD
jgi:tetratricopeptide (TPR) repeat protein